MPKALYPCQSRIRPFLHCGEAQTLHTGDMPNPIRVPITHFAPAERVPIEVIHRQASSLNPPPVPEAWLNAPGTCVLVLNAQRQIVFATPNLQELAPKARRRPVLGLRLGEFLNCIHAKDAPSGCGTGEACRDCGAVQAILSSLDGKPDSRDFRLTRRLGSRKQALQLVVLAQPLVHGDEVFSVVALTQGGRGKGKAEGRNPKTRRKSEVRNPRPERPGGRVE
jgi:hypothetical protein